MKTSRSIFILASVLLCLGLSIAIAHAAPGPTSLVTLDRRDNNTQSTTEQNPPTTKVDTPTTEKTTAPPTVDSTTQGPSTTPQPTPTSTQNTQPTTKVNDKTTAAPEPQASTYSTTRVVVVTFTSTAPDGATITSMSTSTSVAMVTGVAGADSASPSSGLNKQQKSIVIGVLVGVGGAIILGGLAILFWRRKKTVNPIDEDDLMRRDGSPLAGSRGDSLTGPSPFQTTLDQYHKPSGPVNASSNF